jgi:hypothetical protein
MRQPAHPLGKIQKKKNSKKRKLFCQTQTGSAFRNNKAALLCGSGMHW